MDLKRKPQIWYGDKYKDVKPSANGWPGGLRGRQSISRYKSHRGLQQSSHTRSPHTQISSFEREKTRKEKSLIPIASPTTTKTLGLLEDSSHSLWKVTHVSAPKNPSNCTWFGKLCSRVAQPHTSTHTHTHTPLTPLFLIPQSHLAASTEANLFEEGGLDAACLNGGQSPRILAT